MTRSVVDEAKASNEDQEERKVQKVTRLLSTRYGRTCFDVIIAKTPNTACAHEMQLKFLQDQSKLQSVEIAKLETQL